MTSLSNRPPSRATASEDRGIVYIADPMCSWCWGFAPVIRAIAERYGRQAPVRIVPGGLRTGDHRHFDEAFKAMLREHWRRVEAETGQPFNHDFFERSDFNYNTEPACRALVVARHLDETRVLDFLEALQAAFYRDNRDITTAAVLSELARQTDYDADRFMTLWDDPAMREETFEGFKQARRLGARGFPTVLLRQASHYHLLTSGYQPSGPLLEQIDDWLCNRPASLNLF